jgi:hypothetical protein
LQGDFSRALYLNPLAIGVILGLIILCGIVLTEAARGRALADWNALWNRWQRILLPLFVVGMLLWWPMHIAAALRKPKTELVDLRNPVALSVQGMVQGQSHSR